MYFYGFYSFLEDWRKVKQLVIGCLFLLFFLSWGRKSSSDDRRSDGETGSVRSAGSVQTAVPALIQEEEAAKPAVDLLPSEKETKDGKKENKIKEEGKGGRSSNKNSPSTSPPPVSGMLLCLF